MTATNTLFTVFRDELLELLAPLISTAQQPRGVQILLQSVGRTDELGSRPDLRAEIERLANLAQGLADLDADTLESWEGLAKVLDFGRDLLTALHQLDRLVSDPSLAEQIRDLGLDLVQHLLALHLRTRHPAMFRAASLLTLITPAELAAPVPVVLSGSEIVRFARYKDEFHPNRIGNLLREPFSTLAEFYFPNGFATAEDAHEAGRRLFPVLASLAQAFGLSSFSDLVRAIPELNPEPTPQDIDDLDHFSGTEPGEEEDPEIHSPPEPEDLTLFYEAFLPRFVFVLPGQQDPEGTPSPARFAIAALVSSANHPGGARGLVITPLGQVGWSEVRSGWRLSLESSGQVPAFVLGPGGVSRALIDSPLAAATARFLVARVAEGGASAFIVGAADGTRLEIGALRFAADVQVGPSASAVVLAADAQSGAFVLVPGDGDSFLSTVLPEGGLRCDFDLGVELSSIHGLRLRGAAGLDATLPVGLAIGGVTISTIHLNLVAGETGLTAEVSASMSMSLGPVHTAIERVGIVGAVTFPEAGGNLGIGDLSLNFKPPNGVGLSIDEAGVTGGGFLRFAPEKGQYDGIVELTLEGRIAVKGIGLIATHLPGGAKGFSLLIIITAEDLDIQLGLGFKLTGIGGLLAINRTFDENALRAGLKNNTLSSILFPKDPIRNAPQILSNLNKVFPPATGHHLFGPAARIEWGTPTLITADLALVLELGARLRLLVLAHITAILPKPENDLIRLQMDAIGLIDFDQGSAALDATLHDSRLVKKFTLTGDMALRLNWEGQRNFALAVGGLHPAFNPPPNFPKLERIAINLTAGDNPRFRCEAYFALTANTVQFGARAELFASVAGFSIQGEVGFDVLIQVSPFQFLAEFFAQVQVKRGRTNLLKVRVEGALAGPLPLHIKARATFEVLWWDISVRIDKTLLAGVAPAIAEVVDVLAQLIEALGQPGNWVSRLPDGQRQMVTLRARAGAAADVPLHPLGALTVKQNIVPLEMEIAQFGQTTPAGARHFTIRNVNIGGQEQKPQYVRDFFAPAQFFAMSDADKLSQPSFEQMAAGVDIGSHAISFNVKDCLQVAAIEFETKIYDKAKNEFRSGDLAASTDPEKSKQPYTLSRDGLLQQAQFSAAANSDLRRTGRTKYQTTVGKYKVAKEGWSIVATDDLTVQPAPAAAAGRAMSYSEAEQALNDLKRKEPTKAARLKILRFQSEVTAAE